MKDNTYSIDFSIGNFLSLENHMENCGFNPENKCSCNIHKPMNLISLSTLVNSLKNGFCFITYQFVNRKIGMNFETSRLHIM